MTEKSLETLIESIAQNARNASLGLVTIPAETKNRFLNDLAKSIEDHYQDILDANQKDLDNLYRCIKGSFLLTRTILGHREIK